MSTPNKNDHGLNQWVETDAPKMEDFNEDNAVLNTDAMWREDYDSDGLIESGGGIRNAINTAISEVGGFATYLHSKSGATHVLTNATGGANIKFAATAAFAEGDTFEINTTPYTPLMINGAPPVGAFFASGAWVTALVRGTYVYFQSSAAALSNSVSSTSTAIAANLAGVKAAYDRGSTGITNAAAAQTTANTAQNAANAAQSTANTANATANAAMPKAGGQFTGAVYAFTTGGTANQIRNAQIQNSSGAAQSTSSLRFRR